MLSIQGLIQNNSFNYQPNRRAGPQVKHSNVSENEIKLSELNLCKVKRTMYIPIEKQPSFETQPSLVQHMFATDMMLWFQPMI